MGSGTVIARLAVPLYLIAIAAAVLLPDPQAIGTFKYNVGMQIQRIANRISHVSPTALGDIASNIIAFIPLTFLLGMAWRRVPVWVWGLVGMLASVGAETAQYLLPELSRRPDIWNVIENSIGAWIGALLASLTRACRSDRRTPKLLS
ncbi:VanZ family protein [Acidipropionibacterium virtanenii]|uniref:VanZ-like domain-containing protein n=1 Tax=Acidipropionibacterium virtanenii TaxID=2057246 RepID=A0A344UX56_9ACTN|nr:VanZ family protein [Acidipropionibacterium virtanenii]AXE39854.1 hypothetical protein JS278_02719 [Acidipropionibacterium virtanenii]